MSERWEFFKESDTSWGMFYPRNYIIAAFDTEAHAQQAERAMHEAGFEEEDVATASGSFVTGKLEYVDDRNWLDKIKVEIARAVGTEEGYVEDDVKHAARGGSFLFVYAPDEPSAERATHVLKRCHPTYARRYLPLAIDRIIYPKQSVL